MKHSNSLVMTALLSGFISLNVQAQPIQILDQQAQQMSAAFASELMSALTLAIQQGGHPQGVNTCQVIAPAIAARYSQNGWQIGRTSLQLRNTNNQPDNWEATMLKQFAEARLQMPDQVPNTVSKLENNEYRYMRPIVMAQPCLACHGQQIPEGTNAAIKTAYPNDRATGYQLGDIRGAFTLRKSGVQ